MGSSGRKLVEVVVRVVEGGGQSAVLVEGWRLGWNVFSTVGGTRERIRVLVVGVVVAGWQEADMLGFQVVGKAFGDQICPGRGGRCHRHHRHHSS